MEKQKPKPSNKWGYCGVGWARWLLAKDAYDDIDPEDLDLSTEGFVPLRWTPAIGRFEYRHFVWYNEHVVRCEQCSVAYFRHVDYMKEKRKERESDVR